MLLKLDKKDTIAHEISRVNQYKENIGLVFTLITNIQLEKICRIYL